MRTAVHIAATIAFLALAWLFYRASVVVDQVPALVEREAAITRAHLFSHVHEAQGEISEWRKAADAKLDATLELTEHELSAFRRDGTREIAATRETIDRRLAAVQATLDRTVALVDKRTAALAPIPEHAAEVLEQYAATGKRLESITAQVDDALPLFLDCDLSADCLPLRYAELSRSAVLMMDAVAENAPQTAEGIATTSTNVGKITSPNLWNVFTKVGVAIAAAFISRPQVIVEQR